MSERIDHVLKEAVGNYTVVLRRVEEWAVAEAHAAPTVLAALDVVKQYQDIGLFSSDWAEGLRSLLRRRGPYGIAYQRNVAGLESEARRIRARDGLPAARRSVTQVGGTLLSAKDVDEITERLEAPWWLGAIWRRWATWRSRRGQKRSVTVAAGSKPARDLAGILSVPRPLFTLGVVVWVAFGAMEAREFVMRGQLHGLQVGDVVELVTEASFGDAGPQLPAGARLTIHDVIGFGDCAGEARFTGVIAVVPAIERGVCLPLTSLRRLTRHAGETVTLHHDRALVPPPRRGF
jgi:hypothetical protein